MNAAGRRQALRIAATLLAAAVLPAAAQDVSLAGQMGRKALLVIGGQPVTLAVGESARGVRLLQLDADGAVVEAGGQRLVLRPGGGTARVAGSGGVVSGAREIVIPVGPGGHFVTQGAINGRPVNFMVDTGATLIALGQAEAERLGIPWRSGEPGVVHTANGSATAYRVTLSRVRVGEVEITHVQAVVLPQAMPMILLGNSFLSRFRMQRDSDVLRLEAR
ncbi:retropepsin-like aspartic protease family protein [Rubrivivax gelatinosus]|uniref:Aspartyl protease family protein n=1 Tax=Rubrivivax gelatinosus TaxID=28068 RepID=A0A4R2M6F9_RUBGE|nr:retropepsin-like aspartic protease [Rubrivivax gelatinosus]MBK1686989.1 TIGR02281 family clan AA aspartic protease [Rubrivivax gelatinosus]TCP02172.1 aspartyl protease family protein [Rubrivivax gelatinosus]